MIFRRRIFSLSKFTARLSYRAFAVILALLFVIGMLGLFLPAALYSIHQIVQKSEAIDSENELNRVIGIFQNENFQIQKTTMDWAVWDETYQFAEDGNQAYINTNLTDDALTNLGIDLFLITSTSREVMVVLSSSPQGEEFGPPPFQLERLTQSYPQLLTPQEKGVSGLVVVDGQVILVSALPVLPSSGQGPSTGSLVLGVYLDETEQAAISSLSQRTVRFWHPDQAGLPGLGTALSLLNLPSGRAFFEINKNILTGYQVIPDISGNPAMLLSVDIPRQVQQQTSSVTNIFILLFSSLTLILAILTYRFLTSFLYSRRISEQYHERLSAIFKQASEAILLVDARGMILDANEACLRLLNIQPADLHALNFQDVLAADTDLLGLIQELSQSGGEHIREVNCQVHPGQPIVLEISASETRSYGPRAYSLIMRDITAQKAEQAALEASEKRYQLATLGANDGIWDWDIHASRVYYSTRWKAMLGYTDPEISNSPLEWFDRVHPDDQHHFQVELDRHLNDPQENFECQCRMRHKDGHYRWMLVRGLAMRNSSGYTDRMAGSLTDITRQKEIEEQLRHDALHDHLTGLANRTLLLDRISHVNDRKKRHSGLNFALMFLDLDRFKQINDSYGHHVGDQILVEVAGRLESNLRAVDTISRTNGLETLARIAGDEFVILLEDIQSAEDVERIARRILDEVSQPFQIAGAKITINLSIGIVIPDEPYENAENLIRDADTAMYRAKEKGGGIAVRFTQAMHEESAARRKLEYDLRRAVDRHEFLIYYQPIYALTDDHMIGFEALVRWQHPERGLLLPGEFIGLAEETGLIIPIGYEVLARACRQMVDWQTRSLLGGSTVLSVNLSARQLADPDLIQKIKLALAESGLPPSCLWLEITETTFIENLDEVRHVLENIRRMGIRIEIDDFGVGYSSLSYLHNLPIDGFKIDRSFISQISGNGEHIVNTLVELGHNLKLLQVAEGVETTRQKEYLRNLECDYIQGYLMARPVSSDQIEQMLTGGIPLVPGHFETIPIETTSRGNE